MKPNKLKILIITRLPNSATTQKLKALCENRGHIVEVVKFTDVTIYFGGASEPMIQYKGKAITGLDVVLPILQGTAGNYGIALLRQLELMGVYSPNKSIAISRSSQIVRAIQIMQSKGITMPNTVVTRGADNLKDSLGDISLPFLLRRVGDRQESQILIEDIKSANSILSVLGSSNDIFIAQEFDKGSQNVIYKALIVGKKIVASIKVNKSVSKKPIPHRLGEYHIKAVNKSIKSIGLSICEVDLVDGKNGVEVVNLSAEPDLFYYELITGRDVATKVIEYVERNAKQRNKKDKIGA